MARNLSFPAVSQLCTHRSNGRYSCFTAVWSVFGLLSHSQLQREGSTENLKLLYLKINTNGGFVVSLKHIIAVSKCGTKRTASGERWLTLMSWWPQLPTLYGSSAWTGSIHIAAATLASGTLTIYVHIHSSVPWGHLVSIANYYMQPLIRTVQMHTTQTSYLRTCFRYPSGQSHIHIMQCTQLYMWAVPLHQRCLPHSCITQDDDFTRSIRVTSHERKRKEHTINLHTELTHMTAVITECDHWSVLVLIHRWPLTI